VGEEAFARGTGEVELERHKGIAVSVGGERGKMGSVMLTNDRILFTQQKFMNTGQGGALGALVVDQLQKRSEKRAGGPREVLKLADIRSARTNKRRMLPDLYEFTLADGSTSWLSKEMRKRWDDTIRRLLAERHGRTVIDDGEGGWRVE
jgi:hypothetical protein